MWQKVILKPDFEYSNKDMREKPTIKFMNKRGENEMLPRLTAVRNLIVNHSFFEVTNDLYKNNISGFLLADFLAILRL